MPTALTASIVQRANGLSTSVNASAAFNVARLQHPQVPSGAAALHDQLRHVEAIPAASELPARRARLRDLHDRRADAERVADGNVRFALSLDRKILAEPAGSALLNSELLAPERIVVGGIDAHRFVGAAMNLEIGLTVSGEIRRRE